MANLKKISYKKERKNHFIFVPGFLSETHDYKMFLNFLKKDGHNVSVFNWSSLKINAVTEVMTIAPSFLLGFGLLYGTMNFTVSNFWKWKKANTNTFKESLNLQSELLNIKKQRIHLIGHSLGCKLIYNAISEFYIPNIKKVIFFGAALSSKTNWSFLRERSFPVVNCYSSKDRILKTLYKTAEFGDTPLGLTKANFRNVQCKNIDCSEYGHLEYKHYFEHLFKNIIK